MMFCCSKAKHLLESYLFTAASTLTLPGHNMSRRYCYTETTQPQNCARKTTWHITIFQVLIQRMSRFHKFCCVAKCKTFKSRPTLLLPYIKEGKINVRTEMSVYIIHIAAIINGQFENYRRNKTSVFVPDTLGISTMNSYQTIRDLKPTGKKGENEDRCYYYIMN